MSGFRHREPGAEDVAEEAKLPLWRREPLNQIVLLAVLVLAVVFQGFRGEQRGVEGRPVRAGLRVCTDTDADRRERISQLTAERKREREVNSKCERRGERKNEGTPISTSQMSQLAGVNEMQHKAKRAH